MFDTECGNYILNFNTEKSQNPHLKNGIHTSHIKVHSYLKNKLNVGAIIMLMWTCLEERKNCIIII